MGKAFMWVLLGYAVEDGLLDPDAPIHGTWTGKGELSHPHKHLNAGNHKNLTWRHIIGEKYGRTHQGGFPMEIGSYYAAGRAGKPKKTPTKRVPPGRTGPAIHSMISMLTCRPARRNTTAAPASGAWGKL